MISKDNKIIMFKDEIFIIKRDEKIIKNGNRFETNLCRIINDAEKRSAKKINIVGDEQGIESESAFSESEDKSINHRETNSVNDWYRILSNL